MGGLTSGPGSSALGHSWLLSSPQPCFHHLHTQADQDPGGRSTLCPSTCGCAVRVPSLWSRGPSGWANDG